MTDFIEGLRDVIIFITKKAGKQIQSGFPFVWKMGCPCGVTFQVFRVLYQPDHIELPGRHPYKNHARYLVQLFQCSG
jgi:hypothetical protein